MKEVKVTPLGTVAPYCKDDKNCPGFLIENESQKYLIDCGNGVTSLMHFPEDLENLNVIISHLHPDHYGDLSSLAQTVLVYKRLGLYKDLFLSVYVPDNDSYTVTEHSLDSDGWGISNEVTKHLPDYEYIKHLEKNNPIHVRGYNSLNIDNNDVKITSLRVPHDLSSNAIKLLIDGFTIVYSSDTGTKNDLRHFAKDADLFICESTFLQGQYRQTDSHLYANEAAEIARDANVKTLMLTHFWPEIDKKEYKKEAEKVFKNTIVAEEGKTLTLRR